MTKARDISSWFQGERHRVAEAHDAIAVARSLKECKFYSKVVEDRKSIGLLIPRMGVSFSKDKSQARLYMDAHMISEDRKARPDADPLDLLVQVQELIIANCEYRHHLVNSRIEMSEVQRAPGDLYGYFNLEYKGQRFMPLILKIVMMSEVMICVDDSLMELDLAHNVYR